MQRAERRLRRRPPRALGDELRFAVDQLNQRLLAREAAPHLVELLHCGLFARAGDGEVLPEPRHRDDDAADAEDADEQQHAENDRDPVALLRLRSIAVHNVSSVPAPDSEARRKTRSAATTSSTAMPSDLNTVMSSADPRPSMRPSTSSPISPRMCDSSKSFAAMFMTMSPASTMAAAFEST